MGASGLTRIIFSRESCLTVGLSYPLPNMNHSLGRGGNGNVTLHVVNQKTFAVKKTKYRSKELNSWLKLDHRNLVPLLAVMIDPVEQYCYQFMPKMKGNLKSVLRLGILKELSCSVSSEEWKLISLNILYILKSVLKGLRYLQKRNMQHCDVKASNVLIGECSCPDTLHCLCPKVSKFQVLLADFDSMKQTKMGRDPATLPMVEYVEDNKKLMGTLGYRAPEQFVAPKVPWKDYEKTIMDGHITCGREVNCGGPWCDIWSFGVMTARVCLGHPTVDTISDANILQRCPSLNKLTIANEEVHAYVVLFRLTEAAMTDENLKPFAMLASQCLKLKFRERPNANELLTYLKNHGY